MNSSQQLSRRLASQWFSADHREQRLLSEFDWPLRLAIGKPEAKIFIAQPLQVQQHLMDWRNQKTGCIQWQSVKYQSASESFDIPAYWLISNPDEWIAASADLQVKTEFKQLTEVIRQIPPIFHQLIIRHRSLWANKNCSDNEMLISSCQLAMKLESGMAMGRPLRAVSITGFDSKFLENQRGLLTKLLNIRFAGALEDQSLEEFLGASEKGEHWLLLKPLARGILPFELLRLRSSELAQTKLPVKNLIIVENEQCFHQLPEVENTLAILGSGLNLIWLKNIHFNHKNIIYWGDIDTWGLKMLAMARQYQPDLQPLLMELAIFDKYQQLAVPEPKHAGCTIPTGLTATETELYQRLLNSSCGRLEQEYISQEDVNTYLKEII